MAQPLEFPRHYLPDDFDPSDLGQVRRAFEELEECPLPDQGTLEGWCCRWGELMAAILEEGIRRKVDSTRHTGDEEVQARYVAWVEEMEPHITKLSFGLEKRLATHPKAAALPGEEFALFLRSVRTAVDLYRPENVPLEVEGALVVREYHERVGAMTVELEGEERTIPQAYRYLERQDRSLREAAWRAVNGRFLRDRSEMGALYDRLLDIRGRIASNAGFLDYRAFRFAELERLDYTPDDCLRLYEAVERVAVPVERRLGRRRAAKLGLDRLRPWDYGVDPEGREPLAPFDTPEDLVKGARAAFTAVAPRFGGHFDRMREAGHLDLESRKGKAPGGYKTTMPESRMPFIFMNAAGSHGDVTVLFHEGGHAFHDLEYQHQRLFFNRRSPGEFAEVASMSMELLASMYLERSFYDEEEARRARIDHLEGILTGFARLAVIDSFQHWVYTSPGHSRQERAEAWTALLERFMPDTDRRGLEEYLEVGWQRVPHLFNAPFYMVDYIIAQLGALQVWRNYLSDPEEAVGRLLHAFALGYTRPLPELFEAAGIRFDFSAETLGELLAFAEEECEKLRAG